ncbi:carbohydrate sulfotransferase 11-like isoform X2 [Haliotis rubra]|nr:carbohydrate sulfotransferase 11-like isoform X2 [Haliotis rubra]XP_046553766.1 carbohydrate sulfotransferase 11-like isoform X2 [Haliotis rubra]XP_046554486.1 carbohydrate sulfotransferase 11-like isoform X2 [Haliotis rubra]XP_046555148.1 carbohydrate sulfotransferase 11-like isoform X2 [Haliotis rubra]
MMRLHPRRAVVGVLICLAFMLSSAIISKTDDSVVVMRKDKKGHVTAKSPSKPGPMSGSHPSTKDEYCEEKQYDDIVNPAMFKQFLVDDKYKIIYCQVPKAACTNWRRMMLMLTGKMNATDPFKLRSPLVHGVYDRHLTHLKDMTPDQIKYRLKHYYKFMFTREPFERVLSAFRNKFQGKNVNQFFQNHYGKNIMKRFRTKGQTGVKLTFYEFVQYLIDSSRSEPFNEHWERIVDLCHPCKVKYDFIGSYSNIGADSAFVLKRIGATHLKFPDRSVTYKHSGTEQLLYQYYREIPPGLLDQLFQVYYSDFLMFDYRVPDALRNLTQWRFGF